MRHISPRTAFDKLKSIYDDIDLLTDELNVYTVMATDAIGDDDKAAFIKAIGSIESARGCVRDAKIHMDVVADRFKGAPKD